MPNLLAFRFIKIGFTGLDCQSMGLHVYFLWNLCRRKIVEAKAPDLGGGAVCVFSVHDGDGSQGLVHVWADGLF